MFTVYGRIYFHLPKSKGTNPVAKLSKSWFCDESLAGIAGSNPAEGMNVYLFDCCVLCRGLCKADPQWNPDWYIILTANVPNLTQNNLE
jgi:hypothetical protein